VVTAWEVRAPSSKALLVAAASVPPLAGLFLLVSTRDSSPSSAGELAGLGLVLVAYGVAICWARLDRLLLGRDFSTFLARLVQASVVGFAIAVAAFVLFPRLSLGLGDAALAGVGTAVLLLGVRALLPRLVEPRDSVDGTLVLGRRDLAAKLCLDLLGRRQMQRLVGAVDLYEPRSAGAAAAIDAARLGELVRAERISRIIVAEPDAGARRELAPALLECRLRGVAVEDAVEFYQRLNGKLWLEAIDPDRLAFAHGFRITPVYLFVKRVLDLVCAVTLAIVAAPLAALVALAIRLESPGSVLFRQERVGQFGRIFRLYKFRSMRADAESKCGPVWARENDDRVTRLGRFLRRSHLDEIPQVLNVLKGDLSFVGPRPERPCFVEMLRSKIPYYDLRHYVKPGITGWAQVCAPYASSVEDSYEKLQYDLSYAKSFTLGLDLAILFRTAVHVLGGGGR
jgi:exopolysaccharide biosynthesis polyprenyl glycosylphosphotransferase